MPKNLCWKTVTIDKAYEVRQTPDGSWEWNVLKKYQADDNKPNARRFVAVKSPMTYWMYELWDEYCAEIMKYAVKVIDRKDLPTNKT